MITYGIVMTAVCFFILGLIAHSAFEEYMETRARNRRKAKRRAKIRETFGADALSDIDEAVALGNDQPAVSPVPHN